MRVHLLSLVERKPEAFAIKVLEGNDDGCRPVN